jgi:hypothetical protein
VAYSNGSFVGITWPMAISAFGLALLLTLSPGDVECAEQPKPTSQPASAAVNAGEFTASVANFPNEGAHAELSGRAYLFEGVILLCDDTQERPWAVTISGSFAAVGEYALSPQIGRPSATVFTEKLGGQYTGRDGQVVDRYVWDSTRFSEGTVTISEGRDDLWAGSASASRGDVLLEVSFRAISSARPREGITANAIRRGLCDRLPAY